MAHDKAETGNNAKPQATAAAHSGMDVNGNMRIGDEFSISLSGDDVKIMQARTARTKTIPAVEFVSAIREKWFGEY